MGPLQAPGLPAGYGAIAMPMSEEEWDAWQNRRGPGPVAFHLRKPDCRSVRRKLWIAQEGYCGICGLPMELMPRSVDHVVPKARGGADRVGNAVLAHFPCNFEKADRLPTGCELIWLLAVNNRIGVEPSKW